MQDSKIKPLILVVDDDDMSRLLMREALEESGFNVEEADDGGPALEIFTRYNPDIVLLDVLMQEMDGFEACSRLRELPGGTHVPILMLTGLDDVDSIKHAYEAGATDFITKPINYVILGHRLFYMLRATQASEALRTGKKRLTNAQRLAKLGYWEWEEEKQRFLLSTQVCSILGLPGGLQGDELYFSADDIFDLVHPEEKEHVRHVFLSSFQKIRPFRLEHRILQKHNGDSIVLHQEAEPDPDREGHWLGTMQDITERKKSEEKIIRLAYYDSLTELPNRSFLVDYMGYILEQAKRHKRLFSLLSMDLDNFKRINNTWGINVGNQLLLEVSQRLAGCVRSGDCLVRGCPSPIDCVTLQEDDDDLFADGDKRKSTGNDTLARLGGDEFVIFLADIQSTSEAAMVAQRVVDSFSNPFFLDNNKVFLTCSVGVVTYPMDGGAVEDLLIHAELAMHHAKEQGRNNFQFYREDLNVHAQRRLALENELHKAIENNEFKLYYQPKICLRSNRITGVEALIRWEHPQKGLIGPDEFIAFSEESDMIVAIGEWVLRSACVQAKQWHEQGLSLTVAVNVSARQFHRNLFPQMVGSILQETGLSANFLEVEITEGILMEDSKASQSILETLRDMNLHISLDDFGTGYSSLSYLKRFHFDVLKIDKSFVRDATKDQGSDSIIAAIIALSKIMNLKVVAEGVETEAQLQFLNRLGCDEIQGFLYSKALPADELADWIKNRTNNEPVHMGECKSA